MPPPPRVVHLVRRFSPLVGGTERYVHDLGVEQARRGYVVRVITLDRDPHRIREGRLRPSDRVDGLDVIRLPSIGGPRGSVCLRPDVVVKEVVAADVVHLHDLRFLVGVVALTSMASQKALLVHTHGLLFHTTFALTTKRLLLRWYFGPLLHASRAVVLASSATDRAALVSLVPSLEPRTITVENGIDLAAMLTMGRSPRPGRILVPGRLTRSKGAEDLLAALSAWGQSRPHPSPTVVFVGPEEPGERERLSRVSLVLGVSERVQFTGECPPDEWPGEFAAAAVAVFPSRAEGFGLALLEAMAAGTPLIASAIPAHVALLGDLADELTVDFRDPRAVAAKLDDLWRSPAEARSKMSAALRERARGFDVATLANRVDRIYRARGVLGSQSG